MIRKPGCFLFFLIFLVLLGRSEGTAHAKVFKENIAEAINLIVMIEGRLARAPTYGAGIIIGRKENALFIVTANHAVRRGKEVATDVTVRLKTEPKKLLEAEVLKDFDLELDMTVLRVAGLQEYGIDVSLLDMGVLSTPGFSNRGDSVFPVGNPNGVPWGLPVIPDRIAQMVGSGITFQSTFISSGHSGGGLVDEAGVLTGMIVKDSPPFGFATKIEAISEQLRKWGYPVEWKLAAGYDVEGRWYVRDHPLFHLLTLKVIGSEVSGHGQFFNTTGGSLGGVSLETLTDELAEYLPSGKNKGVLITEVQEGGRAFKAGLRAEDIITKFNGRDVDSPIDLVQRATNLPGAQSYEVEVIRNGETHSLHGVLRKGTSFFGYKQGATNIFVRFGAPVDVKGGIRGNRLVMKAKGVWQELQRRTGNYTMGFPAQAEFSLTLQGRVTGEAIHFQYQFDYPELGNHAKGEFTAQRLGDELMPETVFATQPTSPPPPAQAPQGQRSSRSHLRRLEVPLACLTAAVPRVRQSKDRYLSWVDEKKGPTCKERHVYGLYTGFEYAIERCGKAAEDAATPALSDAFRALISAESTALPLLVEANRYYDDERYKDDACAKGQALHELLMNAFAAVEQADLEVREELFGKSVPLVIDEARAAAEDEGRVVRAAALKILADVVSRSAMRPGDCDANENAGDTLRWAAERRALLDASSGAKLGPFDKRLVERLSDYFTWMKKLERHCLDGRGISSSSPSWDPQARIQNTWELLEEVVAY